MEAYAWLKLGGPGGLAGEVRPWAPTLQIMEVDQSVHDEPAAVLGQGKRMLIVEAKAARSDDAAPWICQLSQLSHHVGGQPATAVLLSNRVLERADQDRAQEYGVKAFAAGGMARFAEFLREWAAD